MMRGYLSETRLAVSTALVLILLGTPARATEQAPDATTHPPKGKKASPARSEKAAHRNPEAPLAPWAAADPTRVAKPTDVPADAPKAAASRFDIDPDKIDYGMKANGANVSPGQTRNQNYNGNVTGIGGELGMKVPF